MLIVSLEQVTFMDASALTALIGLQVRCAEAGVAVEMQSPSPVVRRLLTITGLAARWGLDTDELP